MKNKIKKLLLLTLVTVTFVITIVVSENSALKANAEEHVYYTNFECMVINQSSTVDANTGFIWANDWQNTKTVLRKGSTMLEMSIYDSSTYSIIGGFGIADKANLGKCKIGEAYDVQTYFEMVKTGTSSVVALVEVIVILVVLPAVLAFFISEAMRKLKWIKPGDMRLDT